MQQTTNGSVGGSPTIQNLSKALMLFQVKIDTIKFDSNNPFFKSKYASLTHILESIKDALIECNLVISQFPTGENGLTTILMHTESGEWLSSTYYMQPEKNTPQAHGSVVTYQRRYCIQSILNLCFDEDDDGNTATHGSSSPNKTKGDDKPWLNANSDMFHKAVEKLKDGTTTIDKIKLAFNMNKSVEKILKQVLIDNK